MRRKRRQWQIAAGSILHHLPGFPRVKMAEVCPLLCDFVRWDSLYHCIIFLSGSIGVVCRDVFWFGFVGVCAWWRWGTTGVLLLKASGIQCCSGIVPCYLLDFFVLRGTEIEFVSLRNGCLHFHELCLGSLFSIVWGPQLGTSCNKAHTHTSMYVYNCLYHYLFISKSISYEIPACCSCQSLLNPYHDPEGTDILPFPIAGEGSGSRGGRG
jgi:hypothetical protein